MSKKTKNRLFEVIDSLKSEVSANSDSPQLNAIIEVDEDLIKNEVFTTSLETTADRDLLTKFDVLSVENLRLQNENNTLMNKMSLYISEIEQLRIEHQQYDQLSKLYSELSSKAKSLVETIDLQLLNISELTFENAKLLAALQSATVHEKDKLVNLKSQIPTSNRVPYQQVRNNGYESWN